MIGLCVYIVEYGAVVTAVAKNNIRARSRNKRIASVAPWILVCGLGNSCMSTIHPDVVQHRAVAVATANLYERQSVFVRAATRPTDNVNVVG